METSIMIAGFGGQGILVVSQLLAQAASNEGKQAVCYNEYTGEVRGGTVDCTVTLSEDEIGSPLVSRPWGVVAMNERAFRTYEPRVRSGGLLLFNSSLLKGASERDDVTIVSVPANELAQEVGDARVQSMVAIGALVGATGLVSLETLVTALDDVIPPHRRKLIPLNQRALRRGAEYVRR